MYRQFPCAKSYVQLYVEFALVHDPSDIFCGCAIDMAVNILRKLQTVELGYQVHIVI